MPPASKRGEKRKSGASKPSGAPVGAAAVEPGVVVGDEVHDADCGVEEWREEETLSAESALEDMKIVSTSLMQHFCEYFEPEYDDLHTGLLRCAAKYEKLLMRLIVDNEGMKGRLRALASQSYIDRIVSAAVKAAVKAVVPVAAPVVAPVVPPVADPAVPTVVKNIAVPLAALPVVNCLNAGVPVPKPVETWSLVVRGKKGASSKEILEKVVKQVGPTMGVRVHEMRQLRDGGAVIRTPSIAEREKLVKNPKFVELGLEVLVNEKAGPRVMVSGVHADIAPDVFMNDLFEMNFREWMSLDDFKRKVRMASKPWKSDAVDGVVNVVLEGEEGAMRRLLEAERVYIGWFSFRTRIQDPIPHCFRCLGFDHRVRECRTKENICRWCGEGGHVALQCSNAVRCRNCALRGLPADHSMLSYVCPVYAGLLARANARH